MVRRGSWHGTTGQGSGCGASCAGFGPAIAPARGVEALRATLGGIGGLGALTTLAAPAVPGGGFALPLGAGAALIFALPDSPRAQPWSVVAGNAVAALSGIAVGTLVPDPLLAPAVAVGVALPAMMLARALQPPGGAMAATAAMAVPILCRAKPLRGASRDPIRSRFWRMNSPSGRGAEPIGRCSPTRSCRDFGRAGC